ncbi:MAG TPA: ATP-binding protein [Xanthobacteraceae bacterium]|nr:ATP-binding protein [Xanthobacteraceae bacterium]
MSPGVAVETPAETQSFAVTARDLGLIDDWIEAVGARWQADARTVFAARVCVAELAANVLEHAAATAAPDRITVTLRQCGAAIGVDFVDARTPFDPSRPLTAAAATTVDGLPAGGRGLRLLHAYAADLAWRHDGGCNRVTFRVG